MADKEFDPRFDPAFQPGYDPKKTQRVTRSVTPAEPEEPVGEVYVAPPISELPAPSAPRQTLTLRNTNPLLITLWVLSAVFVATGIYALRLIGDRVTQLGASGGFGGADYYLLQAYTIGAPLLIVLGLATATGTIFLLAARWKGAPH